MDTDPLADAAPPRYTIESDDEDESNPLNPSAPPAPTHTIALKGTLPARGAPLLIASGPLAAHWAAGAALGEQTGAVYVDTIQVGLLFAPAWTRAGVLVSEATARLPLSAMAPYAALVLAAARPSSLALITDYAAPAYAAPAPIAAHDAPLRVLATGAFADPAAAPFAPPNLLTGTPAAFLAAAATSTPTPTTALLVPAPHIPAPAPRAVVHTSSASPDGTPWPALLVADAHRLALASLGEPTERAWAPPAGRTEVGPPARRARDVGEGGMYI